MTAAILFLVALALIVGFVFIIKRAKDDNQPSLGGGGGGSLDEGGLSPDQVVGNNAA